MLVDAAEQWCRDQGCRLVEVTSNDGLATAHTFYRHMGYERSSIRFFKKLKPALRRSIVAPTAESFSSSRS
jgi:hypothetical protein